MGLFSSIQDKYNQAKKTYNEVAPKVSSGIIDAYRKNTSIQDQADFLAKVYKGKTNLKEDSGWMSNPYEVRKKAYEKMTAPVVSTIPKNALTRVDTGVTELSSSGEIITATPEQQKEYDIAVDKATSVKSFGFSPEEARQREEDRISTAREKVMKKAPRYISGTTARKPTEREQSRLDREERLVEQRNRLQEMTSGRSQEWGLEQLKQDRKFLLDSGNQIASDTDKVFNRAFTNTADEFYDTREKEGLIPAIQKTGKGVLVGTRKHLNRSLMQAGVGLGNMATAGVGTIANTVSEALGGGEVMDWESFTTSQSKTLQEIFADDYFKQKKGSEQFGTLFGMLAEYGTIGSSLSNAFSKTIFKKSAGQLTAKQTVLNEALIELTAFAGYETAKEMSQENPDMKNVGIGMALGIGGGMMAGVLRRVEIEADALRKTGATEQEIDIFYDNKIEEVKDTINHLKQRESFLESRMPKKSIDDFDTGFGEKRMPKFGDDVFGGGQMTMQKSRGKQPSPKDIVESRPMEKTDKQILDDFRGKDLEGAMSHRPSKGGRGDNIEQNAPDFYEHPEYYTYSKDGTYAESIKALKSIKNKPEKEVVIYRASPVNELRDGDWITLSKKYAKEESMLEGTPVNEFTVKAKDIQFAGDDINEFGYFPTDETILSNYKKSQPLKGIEMEMKDYSTYEDFIDNLYDKGYFNDFPTDGGARYREEMRLKEIWNKAKSDFITKPKKDPQMSAGKVKPDAVDVNESRPKDGGIIYHGGSLESIDDIEVDYDGLGTQGLYGEQYDPIKGFGVNFATEKGVAEGFSKKGGGKVLEAVFIPKKTKTFRSDNDLLNKLIDFAVEERGANYLLPAKKIRDIGKKNEFLIDNQFDSSVVRLFKEDLESQGYDSLKFKNTMDGGTTVIPFDTSSLSKKSSDFIAKPKKDPQFSAGKVRPDAGDVNEMAKKRASRVKSNLEIEAEKVGMSIDDVKEVMKQEGYTEKQAISELKKAFSNDYVPEKTDLDGVIEGFAKDFKKLDKKDLISSRDLPSLEKLPKTSKKAIEFRKAVEGLEENPDEAFSKMVDIMGAEKPLKKENPFVRMRQSTLDKIKEKYTEKISGLRKKLKEKNRPLNAQEKKDLAEWQTKVSEIKKEKIPRGGGISQSRRIINSQLPEEARISEGYAVKQNKEVLEKSAKLLKNNPDKAIDIINGKTGEGDLTKVGLASIVMKKAEQEGNYKLLKDVYNKTAESLTKAGQEVQSAKMLHKERPEYQFVSDVIKSRLNKFQMGTPKGKKEIIEIKTKRIKKKIEKVKMKESEEAFKNFLDDFIC